MEAFVFIACEDCQLKTQIVWYIRFLRKYRNWSQSIGQYSNGTTSLFDLFVPLHYPL